MAVPKISDQAIFFECFNQCVGLEGFDDVVGTATLKKGFEDGIGGVHGGDHDEVPPHLTVDGQH